MNQKYKVIERFWINGRHTIEVGGKVIKSEQLSEEELKDMLYNGKVRVLKDTTEVDVAGRIHKNLEDVNSDRRQ